MTMDNSQYTFVEVVPGSADDPFTTNRPNFAVAAPVASPAPAAEPVATPVIVGQPEGPKFIPAGSVTTSAPPAPAPVAPAPAPTSQTPPADETPYQKAVREGTVDVYIAEQIAAGAEAQRRAAQSVADKRIAALEADAKATREAAVKAAREARLSDEDLTDDEKVLLKRAFDLDDRKASMDEREAEVEKLFRVTLIANLVQEKGQFGVTADALEAMVEPEEMEQYAKDQELKFWRDGKSLPAAQAVIPSGAVTVSAPSPVANTPPAPAGASAPSDIGGTAAPSAPVVLSKEVGIDAMKHNIDSLPWVAVPVR